MAVSDLSPWLLRAASLVVGAGFGAVAVTVADRLPARLGLGHLATGAKRRSRNIVLVALVVLCALGLGQQIVAAPSVALGRATFFLLGNLALATMVLAAGAIDVEHMELPNALTLGGAVLALVMAPFRPLGLLGAGLGIATSLLFSIVPPWLYRTLRRQPGVGLGDAKLNLLAGAWFGVPGALFVLFAGAFQAALAAAVMRVLGLSFPIPESVRAEIEALRERARQGDAEAVELLADDPMAVERGDDPREVSLGAMRLPMGPFLVLACLEFLFFGPRLMDVAFLLLGVEGP